MRIFIFLLPFCIVITGLHAQVTSAQHAILNNYLVYANQSCEEVTTMVNGIANYYPTIFQKRSWGDSKFVCPVQLENYYYDKALKEGSASGAATASVVPSLKALRTASEKLDEKCKELDTYHKLEDFKKDNYAKAITLIEELQKHLIDYNTKYNSLRLAIEKSFGALKPAGSYAQPDKMMRSQLDRERAFLDLWKLNLREEIHTGWISEELEQEILETDAAVKALSSYKPTMGYPASSMWPSFIDALKSILEVKRHALDDYNHEAKKSDKHSNDVYLSLINYYNGALLASYNSFIDFAREDKYYGIKSTRYVPMFEIRSDEKKTINHIEPFKEIAHAPLKVSPEKAPISKPVFSALGNYVDFINETYRTVSRQRDIMRNFASSASYYKGLTSYAGRGGLSFTHSDFVIPFSDYQKCIAESKNVSPVYAAALNQQAEVLVNILKEMDQLSVALETEVKEKLYEKDHLELVYERIRRFSYLFDAWDIRKEQLYNDVKAIYDAYTPANASSSWFVSGMALRKLSELDHEGLFKAKAYYKGKDAASIDTEKIDAAVREVIANEFTNMKGIEKFGRSHGLCPYTPYEDLPVRSKNLSEHLKKLKPAKINDNGYSHPYHDMVYQYNDVAEYYNKFASLSPLPILKTVKQPELFFVEYPADTGQGQRRDIPAIIPTQTKPVTEPVTEMPVSQTPVRRPEASIKVIRDTVFIEKTDTVFMMQPNEELRSMEGYATNNMVLLLDVSGSMNSAEKLPLLKKSVLDMLSMMRDEDEISIIVFSGKTKVLLEPSSFKAANKIKKAIDALKPGGITDGNAGLKLAYKIADENYIRGGNNRIILATDGEFTVSEDVTRLIEKFSQEDIYLSIFNFGKGVGASKNLEKLSAVGKGNYEFISKENVDIKLIREAKSKRRR
ncbi:MAG TPA: VWA domain-containing protein [Ohtaekwangia sp.]|nr:VWA domain-containing protein [Ohtaekwangia sp.]